MLLLRRNHSQHAYGIVRTTNQIPKVEREKVSPNTQFMAIRDETVPNGAVFSFSILPNYLLRINTFTVLPNCIRQLPSYIHPSPNDAIHHSSRPYSPLAVSKASLPTQ
ncbi:hypothetical protein SCLCIDRAFT_1210790 [Scleroderma citrinum Foug A]|uniref:Uncharacterized protein n=1 Tax=Scleroderma citrinum Foug A TaxID=1036808 RepID=A0A0C3E1T1_9AGAM|nr:hypothetical protein SCLCIDRAFT_1210790 [Scleroderma citrinum Foug A]